MTANLTLIAALPMGGGCMSSLPAEKNEQPEEQPKVPDQTLAALISWQRRQAELLAALRRSPPRSTNPLLQVKSKEPTVQMKSPYFDDLDWPSIVFLDEEPAE